MKYFILIAVLFLVYNANGQIEVGSNNNVGIGITGKVNSKLSVNNAGLQKWSSYFYNTANEADKGALYSKISKPTGNFLAIGVCGYSEGGNGKACGVKGAAYPLPKPATELGWHYGVIGEAGYGVKNYGVYGLIRSGSIRGVAVLGSINGEPTDVNELYAGYFYGKTKIIGEFWVNGKSIVSSDMNVKKDIRELQKTDIEGLMKIKAVKFRYKTSAEINSNKTIANDTVNIAARNYEAEMSKQEHIGLLAQDVEKIFPELVKTDYNGLKGIDYTGLIPVLIEALKSQQLAIENLTQEVNKLKGVKN